MLYTIIDLQQVLCQYDFERETVLKPYLSGYMEYISDGDRLTPYRFHSTNPADYLTSGINY